MRVCGELCEWDKVIIILTVFSDHLGSDGQITNQITNHILKSQII